MTTIAKHTHTHNPHRDARVESLQAALCCYLTLTCFETITKYPCLRRKILIHAIQMLEHENRMYAALALSCAQPHQERIDM